MSTIEQVRAEEREALRRHREGQRLVREARRAREREARQARNERRKVARQQREEIQPALRRARRAYFQALDAACKELRREDVEDVTARFDEADRRMDAYLSLAVADRRLAKAARA